MPFPLQKPFSQLTYPWLTGWELISSGDLKDYPEIYVSWYLKKISHACLLFVNIWQCFVYFFLNCPVHGTNVDWQDMLLPSNRWEMFTDLWSGNPQGKDHQRDLALDGRKLDGCSGWTDFRWDSQMHFWGPWKQWLNWLANEL